MCEFWVRCGEFIVMMLCDAAIFFSYLKFNDGRFNASDSSLKRFTSCKMWDVPGMMIGFRFGEITCNTINVLSIRFKYWIKSDSDKMYNKIDRLMLLFAQPRCIAAGCSPIKMWFTQIATEWMERKKKNGKNCVNWYGYVWVWRNESK